MTVLLGPIVRVIVPKPKACLGGLIRTSRDAYPDVMWWLDALLWPAGWALVGAYAKSRVKPTLERAKQDSEALSSAAEQAVRVGDIGRSMLLLSQAEAIAPEPERRARIQQRIREQQGGSTIVDPRMNAAPTAIGPDRTHRWPGMERSS